MTERGKALYSYISATSNTVVLRRPGTLYGVHGSFPGSIRVDDSHSFPQGALDFNSVSSNTVGIFSGETTFTRGLGLNTGMVVSVSSNSKITVEYE